MKELLRPACALFACLTLLTGGVYPAFVTLGAQALFPFQANGSLVENAGQTVGSELIGQSFENSTLFWGRPSATSPQPYNGAASSGSNLGPTNPVLIETIKKRVAQLKAAHPDQSGAVPVDLVTASASGLDPHISPAAANFQVGRVARARGLSESSLRALVSTHTEQRTFGVLGEPRVNVLRLNLALTKATRSQ